MEIVVLVALVFLALIPANIAKSKGHSFWGYYIFGICFFLPALIVALLISDKSDDSQNGARVSDSDINYHVPVKRKEVGEAYREMWTCPECGRSWYIKGSPSVAKCGNDECGCRVFLERR